MNELVPGGCPVTTLPVTVATRTCRPSASHQSPCSLTAKPGSEGQNPPRSRGWQRWPIVLMAPGPQVWLLLVYGPAPILVTGPRAVPRPSWVQARGWTWWCWALPSLPCPQQSPRRAGCSPGCTCASPALLTVVLIWRLETLADKQCHLSEEPGKSRMRGASRWGCHWEGGPWATG